MRRWLISIVGRRGAVDNLPDFGLSACDKQALRSDDVLLGAEFNALDGRRHAAHRGHMEYTIDTVDCFPACLRIDDIALDELDTWRHVFASGLGQVIEDTHVVSKAQQCFRHVAANEAGAAGDEKCLAHASLRGRRSLLASS